MTESALQAKILKHIKSIGGEAIKVGAASVNGVSDVIAFKGGRYMAIEVKVGYNEPSKLQEHFINKLKKMGGLAICVWSLEELKTYIEKENF